MESFMDIDPAYEGVVVLILYARSNVASSTSMLNLGISLNLLQRWCLE